MAVRISVDVINPRADSIYSVLARKLGRNPTSAECRAECRRIMSRAAVDLAGRGKLRQQR